MNYLMKAAIFYKEENYVDALKYYELAADIYGKHLVEANIFLCKKKLNISNNSFIDNKNKINRPFLNDYFDCIYLVNLKKEVNRRITASFHLKNNNINYTLFEAVNGYTAEGIKFFNEYQKNLGKLNRYTEFNELEIKRGKRFIESAGAIGYINTYLKILQNAKTQGYKRILILEDDILLHPNFMSKFHQFISAIKENWKIIQLGASQYNWDSVDNESSLKKGFYLPRRLDTCGSFAIGIDSSVYDELIEAESAYDGPFDHLPMGEIYENHLEECFVCYPNIIIPDVGTSSIRGGRCQIAHSKKMRWALEEFPYPLPKPVISILISSKQNLKYFASFTSRNDAKNLFTIKFFYYSEDGLRPLHNREILENQVNNLTNIPNHIEIGSTDFAIQLDSDYILTENDLIKYVDNKLNGNNIEIEGFNEVTITNSKQIKGRVSVIIPTYKRPKNLENALLSVLTQDYTDKEIIIISDNGKDSEFNLITEDIINKIKESHPNEIIRYISHSANRNGAAARNTGLLNCTGEYITFLDDDDIYLPDRLSKSINKLKNTQQKIGAVYCGFLGWNSPEDDKNRYQKGNLSKELLLLEYKKHYLHTNTATYKYEALMALNGFDESYRRHQDIELNLRFFEQYEIETVQFSGVRLNPEPSDVSNKIFNIDILNLKNKFLSEFDYVIKQYDESTQKKIFELHWNEVFRYIHDKKMFMEYLNNCYSIGNVQILLKLIKSKDDK